MRIRIVTTAAAAAIAVAVAGCRAERRESAAETATDASHAEHSGSITSGVSRVFFVTPKDGDTIKTVSKIEFGAQYYTIAAVPPGEIAPEQVRPGVGHFHLGVDTDCLPPGQVIPKADPWIHFGTGSNTIEMQLTPGRHRLAVQAGDDMHRTLPGLCEVISVNVVE
jgi:hypothetical protein